MMDMGDEDNSRQSETGSLGSVLRKVNLEGYADTLKDDAGIACVYDLFGAKPEHLAQIFKNEVIFYKVWKGIKVLCGVGLCPKAREVKYAALENFLARVGATDYTHDFHSECIQMDDLIHLEHSDIHKLVPEVGPRGRIIRGLNALRSQAQQTVVDVKDWEDKWHARGQDDDWFVEENKKGEGHKVVKGNWDWDDGWENARKQNRNLFEPVELACEVDWDSKVGQRDEAYDDWGDTENWKLDKEDEYAMDVMDEGKASVELENFEDDTVPDSSQHRREASSDWDVWGGGDGDEDSFSSW